MTQSQLWVNGELLATSSPSIHADDHGFLLGDGIFETFIARNAKPVFLELHLRRLRHGLTRLGLLNTPTDDDLTDAVMQLLAATNLTDARLRLTITPGPGHSPRERGPSPLAVLTATPLSPPPRSASLCTVPWVRNERSPLAGIKSTSWGDNAMVLRHAIERGFDNALLCDSTGRLSECTTSNFFAVIEDQILTPSLETGCLPGIIREVLLDSGDVREENLVPNDLGVATEVFITSSTTGVVPVNRIDDQPFAINGPATIRARAHIDNLQKIHSSSAQ